MGGNIPNFASVGKCQFQRRRKIMAHQTETELYGMLELMNETCNLMAEKIRVLQMEVLRLKNESGEETGPTPDAEKNRVN